MARPPIALCTKCGRRCSADEFLIVVPMGTRGHHDIGRVRAYCEACYGAMGVAGGRQKWVKAFTTAITPGETVWDPVSCSWNKSDEFPDDTSLTYWNRQSITMRVFNKHGRCVFWIGTLDDPKAPPRFVGRK